MTVGLSLVGVAGQQNAGEQGEGGQQQLAGEQEARDQRAGRGQDRGGEVAPGLVGVDGQHGEQGGHGEVQAGDARGDQRSQRGAGGRSGDPVGVDGGLQPQDAPARPGPGGRAGGEGVRLVGQRERAVGLARLAGDPVQGEGQGVEHVPGVDQAGGQGDLGQRGGGDGEPDEQELERPGEDHAGEDAGPPPGQAGVRDQHAEGDADGEDGQADRAGDLQRLPGLGSRRERRSGRSCCHAAILEHILRNMISNCDSKKQL
jgi:hypothetical protein